MPPSADPMPKNPAAAEREKRGSAFVPARALAAWLGAFSLLNILGERFVPGFDATVWWIDFRPLPAAAGTAILLAAAVVLLAYAFRPRMGALRRGLTRALIAALLLVSVWNTVDFYLLLSRGSVYAALPAPLSIFVAAALGGLFRATGRTPVQAMALRRRWRALAALAAVLAVGFPLAQMFFFGKTDYRRPADAIVVFGARAEPDGTCSEALADRVRTGCRLYHEGYAARLILSGGPGAGAVHETEAMKRFAMDLGVPAGAIVLDPYGVNTRATCENTPRILDPLGARRILAVSTWYHLPRIKMTYQRIGVEAYTVPAEQNGDLAGMPWYLTREVAALWAYYLRVF